jgi:rSAM/selenodomain-associated transferase 1
MTMHVLYLVAKAPRPGVTKTRLSPPLSHDQAAELATAFLVDTLASAQNAGCEVRIICRNLEERRLLLDLTGGRVRVDVQDGRDLGDALESAFALGLLDASRGVAVLGTDSPTLRPDVVTDGFAALDGGADVALGPCEDGGYYLLAARSLHLSLFRDMPWSTDRVAAITVSRCLAAGLSTHMLPTWYDVDDAPSLRRLEADVLSCPGEIATSTRALMASWARLAARPGLGEPAAARGAA